MAPLTNARSSRGRVRAAALLGVAAITGGMLASGSGCAIFQGLGGAMASFQRSGSHEVLPKYPGLDGKTFAVLVAADRSIQSDFSAIVPVITAEMTKRLAEHSTASGYQSAAEVLKFQSQHPGWVARLPADLARDLGVDRVVYVDLTDFALTDPGNPYVYNGVAGASVHVIEAEHDTSSEFAFSEPVRVKFPDFSGVSPQQMSKQEVFSELARRFIERSAWMFYAHEEPNVIKY